MRASRKSSQADAPCFQYLALFITRPLYWRIDPVGHARGLADLLRLLLNSPEGQCRLGRRLASREDMAGLLDGQTEVEPGETLGERLVEWLHPGRARQWVDESQAAWLEVAGILRATGDDGREDLGEAHQRLSQWGCELFFDLPRLISAVRAALQDPDLEPQARDPDLRETVLELCAELSDHRSPVYLGLSVDFGLSDTIALTSQLRIWNYHPKSRRLAPLPAGRDVGPPEPLPPEQAAHLLERVFWHQIETLAYYLRGCYGLTEAVVRGVYDPQPPVFYFAAPPEGQMPADPGEYLAGRFAPAVRRLTRVNLGTDDPLSHDVAGGVMEGELLVLRRERASSVDPSIRSWHLILPCRAEEVRWEEVERDTWFVANQLSFIDFVAAVECRGTQMELQPHGVQMSLWAGSADDALQLVTQFLGKVAVVSPTGTELRRVLEAFHNMAQYVCRRRPDMMRVTDAAITIQSGVAHPEATSSLLKQTFTARDLDGVLPLLNSVLNAAPLRELREVTDLAAAQARRVRDMFQQVTQVIQEIVQLERRQIEERAEANQRRLNLFVALLAVATVAPVVVKVEPVSGTGWLAGALWVLLAGLVLFFLCYLFWGPISAVASNWRARRQRHLVGQISRIYGLVTQATRVVATLVELRRLSAGKERGDTESLWQTLESLDEQACADLLAVWDAIEQRARRRDARSQRIAVEALRLKGKGPSAWRKTLRWLFRQGDPELDLLVSQADDWLIAATLLDDRPVPFVLPRALCLLRFKGAQFSSGGVVSDAEFERVFDVMGYPDREREQLETWAREAAPELSAREFVEQLKKKSISASRSTEVR